MRTAEGGKKIVKRVSIREVDGRHLQAHFVLVAVEQIVMPDCQVKHMARSNPRRIFVVVFCSGPGDLHQR